MDIEERRRRASLIRAQNDACRHTGKGHRMVMTAGVAALGMDGLITLIRAIGDYEFEIYGENDPYGEHDYGVLYRSRRAGAMHWSQLKTEGSECFVFRIDLHDPENVDHGAEDEVRHIPSKVLRVMTLMRACEQ